MMESSATGVMLLVVLAACHVPRGTVRAEEADRLRPDHWVARCPDADRVLLDAAGVEAFNRRMLARDRSLRDLAALPVALPAADVSALVAGVSRMPDGPFQHADGRAVDAADRERWLASLALDSIPADVAPRFAIVTRRAALRRFPTAQRVRRAGGPHDIDLFQESAFFPGTPTAAVHATADGRWTFVLGITYAAWIETAALAFGRTAAEVAADGVTPDLVAHRTFPGNQPSTTVLLDELTPFRLGQLLAHHEHRTAVTGYLLGIDSFDQWGVELGKVLAARLVDDVRPDATVDPARHDASTAALLDRIRRLRS